MNEATMKYPPVYKKVDGYLCPENYTSHDQRTVDCDYCGRAKLHVACSYLGYLGSCHGWNHARLGTMSCKGWVKAEEDRRDFLC